MFNGFGLRFISLMLVSLCQGVLSLLSIANIVVANLPGSSTTLPILVIATNAPISIALLVILVLDYMKRSPLGVLNEAVLCAAAGLIDLISAVTILFFSMGNAICQVRSSLAFWNACGAHFAVIALLWTATFLLASYAVCLTYAARRYSRLHPLDKDSVWKKKVKQVHWSRKSYSPKDMPGRRLRKQGPLDIESMRRVVVDKNSQTLSRQMGYASSAPPQATPRSIGYPLGLDSPAGFAERMGYFRRDARGEYVPSTPTLRRGLPSGDMHPIPPERVERGTIFRMQTPGVIDARRPSFPDLPNPFPPTHTYHGAVPPGHDPVDLTAHSWSSSHFSENSTGSSPGFAGIGAGTKLQKGPLRISPPVPLGSPQIRVENLPNTGSIQAPRNSAYLGSQQRPFRATAPLVPGGIRPLELPQRSLQPVKPLNLPASPRSGRQMGIQDEFGYPRKYSLPHSSLATTVSNVPAYRPTSLSSFPQPRTGSTATPATLTRPAFLQSTLVTLPPATLSPSTKQRVSNHAYPLPLPPLSTYPIKSVAASARPPNQDSSKPDFLSTEHTPGGMQVNKDRPLSVVSTISCYSTSSASHGPPPIREHILALTLPARTEVLADESLQRSDPALSRRSSKSRKVPTVARSNSRHGPTSQTLWGGTGNGPARRSLASQFQRPQVQ